MSGGGGGGGGGGGSGESVGLNQTSALVQAGATSATFNIRLPRWTGHDSTAESCMGVPRYLVVSPSTPRQIRYSLNYYFRMNSPQYPFVVKTRGTNSSRKMVDLGGRLAVHMAAAAAAFPLHASVPSLHYDTEDENDPHYQVRLPPRSAMYSSSELFFTGLGFLDDEDPFESVSTPQVTMGTIGGRGRRRNNTKVWGFYNTRPDVIQVFRGASVGPDLTMDVVAAVGMESQFPNEMQVQIELFEIDNATDRQYVFLDQGLRAEASFERATTAFEAMLESLKAELNLTYQMIDVTTEGDGSIVLTNRALPGSGATLIIVMDDEMAEAFDFPRQRSLIFYLDTVRSYTVKVPNARADPWQNRYPISLISLGTAPVTSYVEELGFVNLFGILRESGERKPIESEGGLFHSHETFLTLQFRDSSRNLVAFKHNVQLDLMMRFVRSPAGGRDVYGSSGGGRLNNYF
jgi:hypothetical protein